MVDRSEFIGDLIARRDALRNQLRLMENHVATPPGSPSLSGRDGKIPTTQESIADVKAKLADLDRLILNVRSRDA